MGGTFCHYIQNRQSGFFTVSGNTVGNSLTHPTAETLLRLFTSLPVASVFCHNQTLLVAPCLFLLTGMLIGPVIFPQALNELDGRFSKWKLRDTRLEISTAELADTVMQADIKL